MHKPYGPFVVPFSRVHLSVKSNSSKSRYNVTEHFECWFVCTCCRRFSPVYALALFGEILCQIFGLFATFGRSPMIGESVRHKNLLARDRTTHKSPDVRPYFERNSNPRSRVRAAKTHALNQAARFKYETGLLTCSWFMHTQDWVRR